MFVGVKTQNTASKQPRQRGVLWRIGSFPCDRVAAWELAHRGKKIIIQNLECGLARVWYHICTIVNVQNCKSNRCKLGAICAASVTHGVRIREFPWLSSYLSPQNPHSCWAGACCAHSQRGGTFGCPGQAH